MVLLTKVDMRAGMQGLVEFRNGQRLWCVTIQRDGELFKVRLDMGLYLVVDVNGYVSPGKEGAHDIVKFNPSVKWLTAVKDHIPTEIRLC